jgi:hypothetical protein
MQGMLAIDAKHASQVNSRQSEWSLGCNQLTSAAAVFSARLRAALLYVCMKWFKPGPP